MARCYCMASVEIGDVIQITPSFGCLTADSVLSRRTATGIVRHSHRRGNTQRQITLARDFHTRVLTGVGILWHPHHGGVAGDENSASRFEDRHLRRGDIF
jgi:phenylacetate-coenzyme A ligase PaaK-like adenylate-forming protein